MIRYACEDDLEILNQYDQHISKIELKRSIDAKRILLMYDHHCFIGWLRFNLFWDHIPFMNMLYVIEEHRNKGYGTQLIDYWEKEMLKNHYTMVLTSTLSNEQAQFFYRKHGYIDCGSLLLPQ